MTSLRHNQAPITPNPTQDDLSHLTARHPTSTSVDRLAWAVRAARAWLGPEIGEGPGGARRYQADMRLRVSDHPSIVTFRKAAYVDIGPIKAVHGGWEAEIAWRASSLAPLFPVFAGTLVARPGELSVSGLYAPPGGGIGRAADRALLHVAATRTGAWLLRELDAAARKSAS
ncbi:MAG: hypothetical protein M3P14_02375 [Chloroflexota bacterium]|nr:hypothetical protein [Chloroflexota bacterium]